MCRIPYRLLVSLAGLAVRLGRSKDLEIIVLRHQITVLCRQNNRPALADGVGARNCVGAGQAALRYSLFVDEAAAACRLDNSKLPQAA